MTLHRRSWLLAALAAALPSHARAQADWQRVAVPLYTPRDFVTGFLNGHAKPRAEAWQQACAKLVAALGDAAPADDARRAWRDAALAWSALAAVATGAVLARRSARRVDFQPLRIPLVERAIAQAPRGEAAMERVGSAAKGLAVLEWLLWVPHAPRDAAARAYAQELAQDLAREADAVATAFAEVARRELDDEEVVATFNEIVNQWIGGLEQLRLQRLLRPVQEAAARGARAPLALRPYARIDADERRTRWQALQALGVFDGSAAPAAGQGHLVPMETYLRGRGLNPLADRLRRTMQSAATAVAAAADGRPAPLRRAAQAVGAARQLVEADVAPALDVRVGFSDADGD